MADVDKAIRDDAGDVSAYFDTERFWVIWQTSLPTSGRNRIRRISQDYASAARAEADAERYRKSGAITWVEEARPLAPRHVPAAALAALRGAAPALPRDSVTAIGGGSG
jgi:hypothetical protein